MTTTTALPKPLRGRPSSHFGACRKGFTLAEVLMAMTIGTIVLAAVYSAVIALTKGSTSLLNYAEMNTASRHVLETFSREARMGSNVFTATATQFSFASNGDVITYRYVAGVNAAGHPDGVLQKQVNGGAWDTLLGEVESFRFNYYNLTNDAEAKTITEVKSVQIEATVRRKVLTIDNTNYIISARFTMRNRIIST